MQKSKISTEFIMPDGTTEVRSKMSDFKTLRGRIFLRLQNAIGDAEGTRLIMPGVNSYNQGEYDKALSYFTIATDTHPSILVELQPHIQICKRVLASLMADQDLKYLESLKKWNALPRLFKYFKKGPYLKLRCKYCGHYTQYLHPEAGFAYFNTNNCWICHRGYPMPDFAWDGIDGQAYIYYRHSVLESDFYKEFEGQYDVHPDHTFFMSKK